MDANPLIAKAIRLAGSEAKLGQGTGFTQVAIHKAKNRQTVSAKMALAVHRFTGGEVSASDLRPDLWRTASDVPATPTPLVAS